MKRTAPEYKRAVVAMQFAELLRESPLGRGNRCHTSEPLCLGIEIAAI